jgi:CO/xanthine dehydrogenase FAD-binding subunit
MATITAYWRPTSVREAFELLDGRRAAVLGGGTKLVPALRETPGPPVEVVDLQALPLRGIERRPDDALVMGATATLQDLVDSEHVPEVVREAARREEPSTLRTLATVGGCVATGDAESELLATLLAHEAVVHLQHQTGAEDVALETVLGRLPVGSGTIITALTIRTSGRSAATRTARTPADRAIVAAVARRAGNTCRMALTGVAPTPVLVELDLAQLEPPGDFRGSPEYRRRLAAVLLVRAVEAIA